MGWASGFSAGVNLGNSVVDTYRRSGREQREEELRKELAGIATAKPTTDTGFTQAQGDQLNAAAESGQYDVTWDAERGQYTVRPKAAPDMAGQVAPQQRQQFLGQTYDTPLDEQGVSRARQMAMAGVLEKGGDPMAGLRMRDALRQGDIAEEGLKQSRARGEREATSFEWAKQDRVVSQDAAAREKEYTEGRQKTFNDSAFGQRNAAYAKAVEQYKKDKAAYDAAIEAGDRKATPPAEPARPSVSVGEILLDHATLIAHDIAYGKADSAAMVKFAELQKQVNDEGYAKSLQIAQAGAPLTQVIAQFNAGGNVKLDPAAVVSDKMVDRGNGVKSRVITVKRPDGGTQVIDTLAELDALGKADKIFSRVFQARSDDRAERADARAGASAGREAATFAAGAGQRQLSQTLAALQTERLSPKTTPARRAEIDTLLAQSKGPDTNEPADVKVARALMASGAAPDMQTALNYAINNPDKVHKAFVDSGLKNMMKPAEAVAQANEVMTQMGYSKRGNSWSMGGAAAPQAAAVPPPLQRKVGQTYNTPQGPMIWRGTGWEPAPR